MAEKFHQHKSKNHAKIKVYYIENVDGIGVRKKEATTPKHLSNVKFGGVISAWSNFLRIATDRDMRKYL